MFGNFFSKFFKNKASASKSFQYKKEINIWGRKFYKPIASIYINHKDETWHPYSMYIDSGADITVINKTIGNLIGLKLKPKEQKFNLNGIGGKKEFVYREINIKIVKSTFNVKIAWVQDDDIPLLLGRENVFDKFNICFTEKEKSVVFTEI